MCETPSSKAMIDFVPLVPLSRTSPADDYALPLSTSTVNCCALATALKNQPSPGAKSCTAAVARLSHSVISENVFSLLSSPLKDIGTINLCEGFPTLLALLLFQCVVLFLPQCIRKKDLLKQRYGIVKSAYVRSR